MRCPDGASRFEKRTEHPQNSWIKISQGNPNLFVHVCEEKSQEDDGTVRRSRERERDTERERERDRERERVRERDL